MKKNTSEFFRNMHSVDKLLQQNIRNRMSEVTKSPDKDGLPVLPKSNKTHKKRILVKRHYNIHENVPFPVPAPLNEEEENRPQTPKVGTRYEAHLLDSKSKHNRPTIPCETADVFASNGMYKRQLCKSSGKSRSRSANRRNRCPTPVPFDQPLTKLCWDQTRGDTFITEGTSDADNNKVNDLLMTPRHQTTNPLVRHYKNKHDVTLVELDDEKEGQSDDKLKEPISLTQKVLQHYFPRKLDSKQRILRWLVDCHEKSRSTSTLPTSLPDITYTNRLLASPS